MCSLASVAGPEPLQRSRCLARALLVIFVSINGGCGSNSGVGNDADRPSVKVLYPYSGKGDRSYSDATFTGLFRAMQVVELEKLEVVPSDHDEAASILAGWLALPPERRELLIVASSSYADILAAGDWELGGHQLLVIDFAAPARPGLLSVAYRTFAPSFLAGLAAARVSASGKVAAIGGMDAADVNDFIFGFRAGVQQQGSQFVGPFYLASDASGFSQVAQARETALTLRAEQGVDVIFPVAGESGLGVIEAAHESDGALLAVGVDSDQSYLGPRVIIGSVVKHLDHIVFETILAAAAGTFAAGQLSLGLETSDSDFVSNVLFSERLGDLGDASREAALAAEATYLAGRAAP